jgi:4-phospho-D-threonate 3-dehydrogenase / 4-phospho-D-erythronate 3-dehydrogenase
MPTDLSVRPVIGITMGDAAGIGPEITIKALLDGELRSSYRYVVIGDAEHLRRTASDLSSDLTFVPFGLEMGTDVSKVEIRDLANLPQHVEIGVDHPSTGKASGEYIETAVSMWRNGEIDAICTAPISKKALARGGYDFPGHTEFLADLTETKQFAMSFFAEDLRVVLLSTHLSLRDAIELVEKNALIDLIAFTDREMTRLLGRRVSIAVAGLNPHASEGGLFGTEETDEIEPAVEHCRSVLGIQVSGPYSPDTVFLRGFRGEFDACIALYHDQATIPVKSISFGSGVNVTLGLPVVRTSVDHGTAYDIAGKGIAEARSMAAALRLAGELVLSSRRAA